MTNNLSMTPPKTRSALLGSLINVFMDNSRHSGLKTGRPQARLPSARLQKVETPVRHTSCQVLVLVPRLLRLSLVSGLWMCPYITPPNGTSHGRYTFILMDIASLQLLQGVLNINFYFSSS